MKALFLVATLILSHLAWADAIVDLEKKVRPENDTFLFAAMTRNFPVGTGEELFQPGVPHPKLTYHYRLTVDWLMGISGQFIMLEQRAIDNDLAVWTISHQALRLYRLYYPYYIGAGPALLYLAPTRRGKFPLSREPEFETEIGAAFGIKLLQLAGDYRFEAFVNRWRGVKSMRYHGVEVGVGMGWLIED